MEAMDVGFWLPPGADRPAELAALAEARGFASFWTGEVWGTDAFVTLADAATATDRIALGTGIVNVFSRTPAVLAMGAATLDAVAEGRVRLGVGTSTARVVETVHGGSFDRPVRRVDETVTIVQRLLGGGDEPVSYDGELLSVDEVPPLDVDVPIYNAALGEANRRVTGRRCDGWLPHNIPLFALESAFEVVADAARGAGRSPSDVRVTPHVPTAVAETDEAVRELLRGHVAYYVGSGAGYQRAVAAQFPAEAARVAELWADGDRAGARAAVTAPMVDALGVAGTPETARERFLATVDREVIDEPLVVPAGRPDAERLVATVEALAPDG